MRYSLSTFENAKPNQVRGIVPRTMNRVIGRLGIFLVDTEAPEILSTTPDPDGIWATVIFGNPKTGEATRYIKVPMKPINLRSQEGLHE